MERKFLFYILFLIIAVFIFQACDLPTENEDNGEVCESQRYDVEFLYKRTKPPLQKDNAGFPGEVTIEPSWDGRARYFEKTGPDTYKITIKNFYVNEPRNLANYKSDIAVLTRDYLLRDEQAGDTGDILRSTVVTENIYARVIGKGGKRKLTRTQPATLVTSDSRIREVLVTLSCKGDIE